MSWDTYIKKHGCMLKEGEKVEVIRGFWFYDDFYETGQQFVITAEMVGHSFEDWVKKV
ncbi:hypothetical protein Sam46_gp58 [Bacillus phage vB_BcM_Sam46]|uniref:Uncharacterized protein n=2 Tax=Caudoviricetes TaxID=2731619 RepID=A0A6G9L8G1_9CAUD|nr:hypothetical protein Sam112_gp55 [Bacillus phage vB_BcM_Sam112]QIQ61259.1 hypothetical protein Sam46_gp58 [Bacillus phage vB_BcM_Sam46]